MKPQLKIVPQPQGFELRQKRMDKASDGALWTPEDALYDVWREMQGKKVSCVVVIWREEHDEDDSHTSRWRQAGPHGFLVDAVMTVLGRIMGWR